jgi:hypothetical protein
MSRLFIAWAVILLQVASARAAVESDQVRAGVTAYQRLEYERAITVLQRSLNESLTREEKIVVHRTLGLCYSALDRTVEARRSFVQLLTIDPTIELDRRIAPRVRALFEAARAEVAQQGRSDPTLHHLPDIKPWLEPTAPKEGDAVAATLAHPGGLAHRAELFVRPRGTLAYLRIDAPADAAGRARFVIPGATVRAPGLEYYVMMLDDSGVAIARAGSLATPLEIAVRARPIPLRKRPWFLGVLGGVGGLLLAGALATALALTSPASIQVIPR